MFLVILLYALFASVFTISKTGLQFSDPLFFVGTRMAIAGVLMLAYLWIFQREQFCVKREHLWRIFRLAVFNIYLTNMFEFWGLQHLTSFKTCFIYSLSPFFSALLSFFMFDEKMSSRKWQGLIIGFLGFIPIFIKESASDEGVGQLLFFSWPEIYVMGAAVSSVYGWIILKQLVDDNGYSPLMANALSMVLGGGMALTHSYLTENWNPVPVTSALPFIECTIALILISNLTCYNLYGFLLRKFTATFISFAGFTTPFFTALFGWFYLGEVVSAPFYLSVAVVFTGLLLLSRRTEKRLLRNPSSSITLDLPLTNN